MSGVVGEQTTLYIILDQAEELFAQLDEPTRAEFIGELAEWIALLTKLLATWK